MLRESPTVPTLFLNRSGTPMTTDGFCRYWKAMLQGGGAKGCFPPKRLRHIFASDRLEHGDRAGPSHEHAAIVMGNSVGAWKKHYHTMFQNWGAQQAVDMMGGYRRACVAKLAEKKGAVAALVREEAACADVELFELEEGASESDEEEGGQRAARARAAVGAASGGDADAGESGEEFEIDLSDDSD